MHVSFARLESGSNMCGGGEGVGNIFKAQNHMIYCILAEVVLIIESLVIFYNKIKPREFCEFLYKCITHRKAYHFSGKIDTKMVGFSVRNTFVYKCTNFARPYFPYFTTFSNQTWQFY